MTMTEAAKVRDWLSELRTAAEDDNSDLFRSLVAMISKVQPDLKSQVCQLAGEYLENGETWAADFFKNSEAQPKRVEPPKYTEPEAANSGPTGTASWRRDKAAQPIKVEAKPVAPKLGPVASALLDRSPEDARMPKAPPPPPREAPQAPPNSGIDRLTYPRGLLGHVTQYMVDTSPLPNRWLGLASALCVLAKGLDRKVIGPSGTSTILYILLMAETGAGKQQALQCIRTVLKAMGLGKVIVAGGLASVQAIEEIVEQTPSALVVIDEVGAWLNRISAGGQTGNVAEIPGTLQSLWAWSPEDEWIGTKRKAKEMVTVFGPAEGKEKGPDREINSG
jgi:hypothetical protein